jgi:nitroreductase
VVKNRAGKQHLRRACFDQPQVESASAVAVVVARLAESRPGTDYVTRHLARENDPQDLAQAQALYAAFAAETDMRCWALTQCHIAAANMMTAAAAIGVDSCAIGGFDARQVLRILDLDAEQHAVALLLPLGYCEQTAPPKQRLPLAEIVEYR